MAPLSPEEIIFHNAARAGQIEILKANLHKININSRDGSGFQQTALHKAVWDGHIQVVKFLVRNGAEIDAKNQNDATPLYIAAQEGQLDVVKFLIEKGANVDEKQKDGFTPLHVAAEKRRLEVVKYLTENGANINAKTNDNKTPLYIAAKNGHSEVVDYLCRGIKRKAENEASVPIENWSNKDPCIICLAPRNRIYILLPCGHASMCEFCCAQMLSKNPQNSKCPSCRKPIETYKQIFLQVPE